MKGKELLDLFYNDINYQSTTTEILLHDVNKLSNNLRDFKKIGNYKKYFLKIYIKTNDIKKVVKQFDSFLTELITFYENINWNKEDLKNIKTIKQNNQKLYNQQVVGAMQTFLMFTKTETFIKNSNRYEINDKIIVEYINYLEESIIVLINSLKNYKKEYRFKIDKVALLRTKLLSDNPIYVNPDLLNECMNVKKLKSEVYDELVNMISEKNKQYEAYQLTLLEKNLKQEEEKVEDIENVEEVEYINLQSLKNYRINEYMNLLRNFYCSKEETIYIIEHIKNKLGNNYVCTLLSLIKEEIETYRLLMSDNKCSKEEATSLEHSLYYWIRIYELLINKEEEKEINNNKFIFAVNNLGVPYILNDIDKFKTQFQRSLLKCFYNLDNIDKINNVTKLKKLTDLNVLEVKDYQLRIFYKYLPNNYIFIMQAIIKKSNWETHILDSINKRLKDTSEQYNILKRMIENNELSEDLINVHSEYKNLILKKIASDKSLQMRK